MKSLQLSAIIVLTAATLAAQYQNVKPNVTNNAPVNVTVSEGTSMSVAVSPDGRTLAIDLQGSIWTLPAAGGTAKRITDLFNDARQPMWSPDGKWITFFAYRDGGYDIWAIAPDGTHQHKLTWGPFDDREPVWSHDGTTSRSPPTAAIRSAATTTSGCSTCKTERSSSSRRIRPTTTCRRWSPDDKEIAFASTRDGGTRCGR